MSGQNDAAATAKALHNRLTTDPGVQALLGAPARLYDDVPEDVVYPYVTYGDMRSERAGGDVLALALHKTSLHIWSRYGGRAEALDILGAVSGAILKAPLALEDGRDIILAVPYQDVMRAPDGRTLHGILRLHVYTYGATDEALS